MGRSGSYTVTAAAPGIPTPANFSLTNTAGAAGECDGDGGDTAKRGDQHGVCDGAAGDGAGCGQQSGVGGDGDVHGAGQRSERELQRL